MILRFKYGSTMGNMDPDRSQREMWLHLGKYGFQMINIGQHYKYGSYFINVTLTWEMWILVGPTWKMWV